MTRICQSGPSRENQGGRGKILLMKGGNVFSGQNPPALSSKGRIIENPLKRAGENAVITI